MLSIISSIPPREPWSLPFDPPNDTTGRARTIVQAVDDGWLVALDAGEWGGSLWWISSDGSQRVKLGHEHVVALLPRGDVVWAPGSDTFRQAGIVLRIEKDGSSRWQTRVMPQTLSERAEAATLDGETLLIATSESVEAVDPSGNISVLAKVDWLNYAPNSLYRTRDGIIFVGLHHGVARLVPDSKGGHVEDWLVPPACRQRAFMQDTLDCACVGLMDRTAAE
jgi:hypothetical protein